MNIVSNCNDFGLVGILSVVRNILNIIQIIAPILCMISLIITFTQLVKDPDNKKLLVKVRNSIIAVFTVFFIPVIVNAAFGIFGESTNVSSCWQMAGNTKTTSTYIPIDDKGKQSIVGNPDEYKQGEEKKKLDKLIYYSQVNYPNTPFCSTGKSVANSGCGSVSFAMISSSYINTSFEPVYVSGWFCDNKYNLSDGGLIEDAVEANDTMKKFGLKGQILFDKTGQESYDYGRKYDSVEGSSILRAVNSGQAVMFGMPGHWSVAGPNSDCPNDKVYLYNPSRPTSNGCYTPEELFNYTYNYNNRCQNQNWCGWDVAIALSD